MDFCFSIDVPIRNEWENVDRLRSSVQNCFSAVFHDVDGCNAISMVTGELLENAIKYGDWSGGTNSFHLKVWGAANRAYVSVQNPVRTSDPGVAELLRTLQWIDEFPSASQAYKARLLQIADTPTDSADLKSRLGIVRVAYEGNCTLRAELTEARALRITAEVPF